MIRYLKGRGISGPWQLIYKVPLTGNIEDLGPMLHEAQSRSAELRHPKVVMTLPRWNRKSNGNYVAEAILIPSDVYKVVEGPEGYMLRARPNLLFSLMMLVGAFQTKFLLVGILNLCLVVIHTFVLDHDGINGFLRLILKEKGLLADSTPSVAATAK